MRRKYQHPTRPSSPEGEPASPNLHRAAMVVEHDALTIDGSPGAAAWHDGHQAVSLGYTTLSAIYDAEAALAKVYAESGARRTQHPNGRSEYLGPIRMDGGTGRLRVFTSHEEELVRSMLRGTGLAAAYARVVQAEAVAAEANRELDQAKRALAKAMYR